MITEKRGKNVAVGGVGVQLVVTVVVLVIWLWTGSLAGLSGMLLLAAGIPLWLMVAFVLYCRQLARREETELAELAEQGAIKGTIFEGEDGTELRPAAGRAAFVERWVVPVFTLLWAGLHVTFAAVLSKHLLSVTLGERLFGSSGAMLTHKISNAQPGMLLVVVVGFAAFLFSRYATGMSKDPRWRLLRATGSYLLVNVLFMAAVLGGLIGAWQGNVKVDVFVAYLGPIIQFVLAGELVLNFILDLYRPRVPGQEYRPSLDSRLCNLVAEPGRVGHSIAETLNYQFGFEVSKTWFYQLLSRAFVSLLILAGLVLIGMTSIVIVREGEQHVVLHWGRARGPQCVLDPGLHFKWPWPIDTTRRFSVAKVHEIVLGLGEEHPNHPPDRHEEDREGNEPKLFLWTEEHPHGEREELDFLIAVPPESRESERYEGEKPPPPVSIIKLVVPVQYMITDVYKYGFGVRNPEKLLEAEAHREMVRYCASATLDSAIPGGERDRPEAIMTYGRRRAARELQKRIQAAADRLDLGVEITFVGVLAAHPPAAAAEEFEKVLEAERRRDQKRYQADGQAYEALVWVAGDPDLGVELAAVIRMLEELRSLEQLRREPAEQKTRIRDAMRAAEDNGQSLQKEIFREKLLGQVREGKKTAKENLRERYEDYLKLLREISADTEEFDYRGVVGSYNRQAEELFAQVTGQAAVLVAQAEAQRCEKQLSERARYESFQRELSAYQASPKVYCFDRWLDVWDEVLPNVSKYVFGVDRNDIEVWLNWEQEVEAMEGVYQEETGEE